MSVLLYAAFLMNVVMLQMSIRSVPSTINPHVIDITNTVDQILRGETNFTTHSRGFAGGFGLRSAIPKMPSFRRQVNLDCLVPVSGFMFVLCAVYSLLFWFFIVFLMVFRCLYLCRVWTKRMNPTRMNVRLLPLLM